MFFFKKLRNFLNPIHEMRSCLMKSAFLGWDSVSDAQTKGRD